MARLDGDNAAQVAEAMGFSELVTKSGYLTKRAKQSARNWKKRYFVLSGHALSYYENNKNLTTAKGSFLLTTHTEVVAVNDASFPACFEVASEFETMRIAAKDAQEVSAWMTAIQTTVSELDGSNRCYMEVSESGMFGSRWNKRFFMLHSNSITIHQDHMHSFKTLGTIRITTTTQVSIQEQKLAVKEDNLDGKSFLLRPSSEETDPDGFLGVWKAAIEAAAAARRNISELPVQPGEENTETTVLDGYLRAQVSKSKWVPRFFALTTNALYMAEDDSSADALTVFLISPSCSVFETNLKENAFELVTAQQALHVHGADAEVTRKWITSLRSVISKSKVSRADPLLTGAMRMDLNTYEVHFEEKKPLGIVLERSREWALVKLSNTDVSTVSEGSSLAKINGESVMLKEYSEVIKMLTGWKPPLTLTFIRAPAKEGFLGKMSRGRRRSVKNWKRRYFILKQGKLAYYSMDTETPELKGCVQLMGSAVSLVQADEIGQNFCFRVVSGVATLAMQAETVEEMMEWATTLYHAIAIANGGGYLLNLERKLESEREAQRAKEAMARAEAEAAERKRIAAEAERIRLEKEAAEEEARKVAEEAEAEAERARIEAEKGDAASAEAEAAQREAEEKQRLMEELDKERKDAAAAAEAAELEAEAAEDTVHELQEEIDEAELAAEAIEQRLAIADDGETTVQKRRRASIISKAVLDDFENEVEVVEGGEAGAAAAAAEPSEKASEAAASFAAEGAEAPTEELTEDEAVRAFSILDNSGTGVLNPMRFSNVLRGSGVSTGNLHLEMKLYSKFDLTGKVGIRAQDIVSGLALLVDDKSIPPLYHTQLTAYLKDLGREDAEKFSL